MEIIKKEVKKFCDLPIDAEYYIEDIIDNKTAINCDVEFKFEDQIFYGLSGSTSADPFFKEDDAFNAALIDLRKNLNHFAGGIRIKRKQKEIEETILKLESELQELKLKQQAAEHFLAQKKLKKLQ